MNIFDTENVEAKFIDFGYWMMFLGNLKLCNVNESVILRGSTYDC